MSLGSCQFLQDSSPLLQSGRNDRLEPDHPSDSTSAGGNGSVPDTTVYVTAVDYPEGTDWVKFPYAPGSRLVLFANGVKTMEIPVGAGYLTTVDSDMHRLRGGHLYTDYSTAGETVILKDGRQVFRYPGRESLKGFLLSGEDIYTLGQDRDGDGWSFRKNGTAVSSSENGIILSDWDGHSFPGGALQKEGEKLSFYWHIPVSGETGFRPGEFFKYEDGRSEALTLPSGATKVLDIRSIGGKTVICYSGPAAPMLSVGGSILSPGMNGNKLLSCRIYPTGDGDIRLGGRVRYSEEWTTDECWDRTSRIRQFTPGVSVGEYSFWKGEAAYVSSLFEGYAEKAVRHDGEESFTLPSGGRLMARRCFLLYGGRMYVAVSGEASKGSGSGLWVDGKFTPYEVNGPLTGVWVEP